MTDPAAPSVRGAQVPEAARATAALWEHDWADKTAEGVNYTPSVHSEHNFDSRCAICRGDIESIMRVAAPVLLSDASRIITDLQAEVSMREAYSLELQGSIEQQQQRIEAVERVIAECRRAATLNGGTYRQGLRDAADLIAAALASRPAVSS